MEEALTYIAVAYLIICFVIGAFYFGYFVVSTLCKVFKKSKESDVNTMAGFDKDTLTTSEILYSGNKLLYHRDIVELRKYCIEQTSAHSTIENRIKEAKILEIYLLNKEE